MEGKEPANVQTPKVKEMNIMAVVDADRARDMVARRSVTGVLMLVNNTASAALQARHHCEEFRLYACNKGGWTDQHFPEIYVLIFS